MSDKERIDELRRWLADNQTFALDDARSVTISVGAMKAVLSRIDELERQEARARKQQ